MKRSILQLVIMIFVVSFTGAFAGTTGKAETKSRHSFRSCEGSQLTIRPDPNFSDGAMGGQRGASYVVKNMSAAPCTIKGTPGIVLLDARGRTMGKRIAPKSGAVTTIKGRGKVAFEVGYHSCEFAAQASGKKPSRCRISRTAQIRFFGVSRVYNVKDRLDPEGGIEQVMEWIKD
ncbi:MAG: DUF4232 domain-containing protein [Pyrinomonadaceae bacterium]